jgi:hypothetical protein
VAAELSVSGLWRTIAAEHDRARTKNNCTTDPFLEQ